jgi:AcrR family transcriptional regulator
LLAAAERVFAEKGYEAASVGDLAAAAGYTKGALYAHFATKEDLFKALLIEQAATDTADLTTDAPTPRTADVLVNLEAYLYALRHPNAREWLIPLADAQLRSLAEAVAAARPTERPGGNGAATPTDRDIAVTLAANSIVVGILSDILPGWDPAGAARRIADHLLAIPQVNAPSARRVSAP